MAQPRTSYIFASGYLALLLAVLAGTVSCLAPFWIRNGQPTGHGEGLWAKCNPPMTECTWFYDDDDDDDNDDDAIHTSDWQKACQGLFAGGMAILLVTCLTATCHVCCRCCKESSLSLSTALGWITIVGFALLSVSISLFGILISRDRGVGIDIYSSVDSKFDWAYYAAIASSGSSLVAATLFICDGNRTVPPASSSSASSAAHPGPKMV